MFTTNEQFLLFFKIIFNVIQKYISIKFNKSKYVYNYCMYIKISYNEQNID